jgi:hypothetical protein
MTRGHVSWHDWSWRIGEGFRRFDDPTDGLGSGDDGGRVAGVVTSPLRPHESTQLPAGRWSAYWVGQVNLGDYSLSAAVNGRDGFALPHFRRLARPVAGIADVQVTGAADSFTTKDLWTVDARLSREISLGDLSLSVDLEAVNLLDAGTVVAREIDLGVTRGGAVDEILAPRTWRLGVRLQWR